MSEGRQEGFELDLAPASPDETGKNAACADQTEAGEACSQRVDARVRQASRCRCRVGSRGRRGSHRCRNRCLGCRSSRLSAAGTRVLRVDGECRRRTDRTTSADQLHINRVCRTRCRVRGNGHTTRIATAATPSFALVSSIQLDDNCIQLSASQAVGARQADDLPGRTVRRHEDRSIRAAVDLGSPGSPVDRVGGLAAAGCEGDGRRCRQDNYTGADDCYRDGPKAHQPLGSLPHDFPLSVVCLYEEDFIAPKSIAVSENRKPVSKKGHS